MLSIFFGANMIVDLCHMHCFVHSLLVIFYNEFLGQYSIKSSSSLSSLFIVSLASFISLAYSHNPTPT